MEVQFAGEDSISIEDFKTAHNNLIAVNTTLSGNNIQKTKLFSLHGYLFDVLLIIDKANLAANS